MNTDWLERRKASRAPAPRSTEAQIWQARISFCTLCLAIVAFLSWANQELAKRQADVAIESLRRAHAFARCFRSGGIKLVKVDTDERALLHALEKRSSEMAACATLKDSISESRILTKNIIGANEAAAMQKLELFFTRTQKDLSEAVLLLTLSSEGKFAAEAKRNAIDNAIRLSRTSGDVFIVGRPHSYSTAAELYADASILRRKELEFIIEELEKTLSGVIKFERRE